MTTLVLLLNMFGAAADQANSSVLAQTSPHFDDSFATPMQTPADMKAVESLIQLCSPRNGTGGEDVSAEDAIHTGQQVKDPVTTNGVPTQEDVIAEQLQSTRDAELDVDAEASAYECILTQRAMYRKTDLGDGEGLIRIDASSDEEDAATKVCIHSVARMCA